MPGMPPGNVTVSVSHSVEVDGRWISHDLAREALLVAGRITVVGLAVSGGTANITGAVYIQDLRALMGEVKVYVDTASGIFTRSAAIKPDGTYSLSGLPSGAAQLAVRAGIHEDRPVRVKTVSVDLQPNETTQRDIRFGRGCSVRLTVLGEDAWVVIVQGEVAFPSGDSLVAYQDIERLKVWAGESRPGETMTVEGLEPGVYTVFTVNAPFGNRRIDGAVVSLEEDETPSLTLEPVG